MPLTEPEKVKIRHHCGYLAVQEAYTFVLGVPAGVETQFIIEGAMNRVMPEALGELRRHLAILDKIEEEEIEDSELLSITSIDTIHIDDRLVAKRTALYNKWVNSLCNLLGVCRNPFDQRLNGIGSSGLNARVNNG